jgi:hypothetical protein
MRILVAILLSALLPLAAPARTIHGTGTQVGGPEIYPGCTVVPTTYGNVWYIDPVNGSDLTSIAAGGGTAAHPWQTVQSLTTSGAWGGPRLAFYPGSSGQIHDGDEVLLNSGTYNTALSLTPYPPITLSKGLTIAAAPGQTPVLNGANTSNINRIRISGLTLRGTGSYGGALMYASSSTDIVFDNNNVAVVEDAARTSYTAANWTTYVTSGGVKTDNVSRCISVSHNTIHNVTYGANIFASNNLIADNTISYTIDDAIDFGGDHYLISGNFMHDQILVDGNHPDCIQGWGSAGGGHGQDGQYVDILIQRNWCQRSNDPTDLFATAAQGIDAFNSGWTDVRILDNVVVTTACWGLSWGGAHYALFAHNTVVWDGSTLNGACTTAGSLQANGFTSTEYGYGDHIVFVDNISPTAQANMGSQQIPAGSRVNANMVTNNFWYWNGTSAVITEVAGTYFGDNVLSPNDPPLGFTTQSRSNGPFDFHLTSGSPAIGLGETSSAELSALTAQFPNITMPLTDYAGNAFSTTSPPAGAYTYP